jgi:hypothetical protein
VAGQWSFCHEYKKDLSDHKAAFLLDRCSGLVTAVIKCNAVELQFNIHQGTIFPHLTFIVNDLCVQFPPFKILLSLMFQSTAPQRNLK